MSLEWPTWCLKNGPPGASRTVHPSMVPPKRPTWWLKRPTWCVQKQHIWCLQNGPPGASKNPQPGDIHFCDILYGVVEDPISSNIDFHVIIQYYQKSLSLIFFLYSCHLKIAVLHTHHHDYCVPNFL